MKKILFSIFFLLLSHTAKAEIITLRFDDLPEIISSQNGDVLAEKSYVQGAASQKGHLQRSFLPELKIEGGLETFKTGDLSNKTQPTANATAKMNLFHGGTDQLQEKVLQQKYELAQVDQKKIYLEKLLRVRLLYADALYFGERLQHAKMALAQNNKNLKQVQNQVASGLTTETEILAHQMQTNRLKQDLLLFEEDREHAVEELKAVLAFEKSVTLKLATTLSSPLSKNLPASLHTAITTGQSLSSAEGTDGNLEVQKKSGEHPDVSRLKLSGKIYDLQKRQLQRWWMPSLDTYALYSMHPYREREYDTAQQRSEYVFGVNLSVNLLDGFQASTKSKMLESQQVGLQLATRQKERELEAQFEKLQHELKTRRQMISLLKENVSRGQKQSTLVWQEAERGTKTGVDLLESTQQLYQDKEQLSALQRDSLKIRSALMVMLGF